MDAPPTLLARSNLRFRGTGGQLLRCDEPARAAAAPTVETRGRAQGGIGWWQERRVDRGEFLVSFSLLPFGYDLLGSGEWDITPESMHEEMF